MYYKMYATGAPLTANNISLWLMNTAGQVHHCLQFNTMKTIKTFIERGFDNRQTNERPVILSKR